jgi:hypothetical protein
MGGRWDSYERFFYSIFIMRETTKKNSLIKLRESGCGSHEREKNFLNIRFGAFRSNYTQHKWMSCKSTSNEAFHPFVFELEIVKTHAQWAVIYTKAKRESKERAFVVVSY